MVLASCTSFNISFSLVPFILMHVIKDIICLKVRSMDN